MAMEWEFFPSELSISSQEAVFFVKHLPNNIKTIIEFGTALGNGTKALYDALPSSIKLYTLDIFEPKIKLPPNVSFIQADHLDYIPKVDAAIIDSGSFMDREAVWKNIQKHVPCIAIHDVELAYWADVCCSKDRLGLINYDRWTHTCERR